MEVSVIVACRNAAEYVGEQVRALANQDFTGSYEVILVDDGSSDASGEAARCAARMLPNFEIVVRERSTGVGPARNAGLERASGAKLLFCDADDVVASGWVSAMSGALDEHDFVAGASEIHLLNSGRWIGARGVPQQHGLQTWTDPRYLPHAGGGNLGVRREVLEKIGPFDESPALRFAEAAEYCFRAQLAGHALHFEPDAVLHVRLRSTYRGTYRQARGWAESSVGIHVRYAAHGMQPPNWRRGVLAWGAVPLRLLNVRSAEDFAWWCFKLGWRVGRLRGSVANRVLAL